MRTLLVHHTHIRRRLICPIGERLISRNCAERFVHPKNRVAKNSGTILTDKSPCHVRIVGSGAEGAPKAILFSTHKNRLIYFRIETVA